MGGISDEQRSTLAKLAPLLDESTYLAEGVAVALELQHRTSVDLDLFVEVDFDPFLLAERLSNHIPSFRVVGRAPGTLNAEVMDLPVSILSYRYPLIAPTRAIPDILVRVASYDDLACMKLSAIAGRGAAKDFWDLYELLRRGVAGGELSRALELFCTKYVSEDIGYVVRSLAYFGDAEAAPLPRGLTLEQWATVKEDISERVRRL